MKNTFSPIHKNLYFFLMILGTIKASNTTAANTIVVISGSKPVKGELPVIKVKATKPTNEMAMAHHTMLVKLFMLLYL